DSTEIDTIASSAFIPQWSYKGTLYQKHDTIPACENMPMDISLLAPGPGAWVWDASPYLATLSGPVNTITVKDTNTFRAIRTGCGQPDTMYLTVCGIPVVRPVLSLSGNTISVSPSGYAGYQWYRDGVLIPGATLAPYIASKAGKYFVRATDANGCISNSDTVDFSILSVNEPATARHIRIFPNPSSSIVQIAAPFPLQATLTDLSGRVLLHRKEARELDLSSFADGLYLLCLADAEGRIISTQKLLKQRDL
ncbi:MAG: T9SS type A sorting domain-containing protein, partial [Chitinophagaceae bacterium]|nr:T9SS type A sorting domain-containing protein [Chitinophagaceae bacterium]